MQQKKLPVYSPDMFVGRKDETEHIMNLAYKLVEGRDVENRVVNITGPLGSGKSWLLNHLEYNLGSCGGVVTFQFSSDGLSNEFVTALIIKDITEKIGSRIETSPTLSEDSRRMLDIIRPVLDEQALVLLVDDVNRSHWGVIEELDNYILGPLISEPRVMVVTACRGQTYPWKTYELRNKADNIHLQPFPEHLTGEQLKLQYRKAVSMTEEIHELSGGNPLLNYILAAYNYPNVTEPDQIVEEILGLIPIPNRSQDPRRIREYLEALCVPRFFTEDHIPKLLGAYYGDDTYLDLEYPDFVQLRREFRELPELSIAELDPQTHNYVLDGTIQRLMGWWLQTYDPDRWKSLHGAAVELYEDWMEKHKGIRDSIEQELRYHESFL